MFGMRRCFTVFRHRNKFSKFSTAIKNDYSSTKPGSKSLLKGERVQLVKDEKVLLSTLYNTIQKCGGSKDDLDLILDMRSRMDDFFTLVVCGEFNSGKSTLINALFGQRFLKEGLLPTTHKINIIRAKNNEDIDSGVWRRPDNFLIDDVEELNIDLSENRKWLEHVAIVDTPGTNAIIKKHEQLTQRIIPRADLILFVTSAERPLSDSESHFLEKIRGWGKKVIMCVNKIDILDGTDSKKAVLDYVSQNTAKVLETSAADTVPVYGISGKQALDSRLWAGTTEVDEVLENSGTSSTSISGSSAKKKSEAKRLWTLSEMTDFEEFLRQILSTDSLIESKLTNPLLTSDRLVHEALQRMNERKEMLDADKCVLDMIDDHMKLFKADCNRDTTHYRQRVSDIVERLRVSLDTFLTDNISLTRPQLLMDSQAFQKELSSHLRQDLAKPIDQVIEEMTNIILERAQIQARSVLEFLGTRPQRYEGAIIGRIPDEHFSESRSDLLVKIRTDVRDVFEGEIAKSLRGALSKEIGESTKLSMQMAAGAGVASAGSFGGMLAAHCLDITGVLFASSIAIAGLLVVPTRRKFIRDELNGKFDILKNQLDEAVETQVTSQTSTLISRIMDNISPYTRFVRIEMDRLDNADKELQEMKEEIDDMLQRVRQQQQTTE